MDYLRPVEFGLFVTPSAAALDNCFALADLADGRVEFLGVQDHPYQKAFVDTFTLIGALLDRTEEVRVFPDVANLPLRPPAVMAQAAATLDLLSDGRFELGLGAGAFWPAIAAMDGPERTPGEAAGALKDAVEVIRLMWSGERSVRFPGEHYRLDGVHPGPRPAHDIGIWLGVGGPKLLRYLGGHADGWAPSNSFFPPPALPERHEAIDDGARAAGRDPASINVSFTTGLPGPGSPDFSADATLAAVADLAAAGVTWCSTGVPDDSVDAAIEALERYGAEVIAQP